MHPSKTNAAANASNSLAYQRHFDLRSLPFSLNRCSSLHDFKSVPTPTQSRSRILCPEENIHNHKSNTSLPSIQSSTPSSASTTSSIPSNSPLTAHRVKLRKNQSLSALHYRHQHDIDTFSAPISPKYEDSVSHYLPPIHSTSYAKPSKTLKTVTLTIPEMHRNTNTKQSIPSTRLQYTQSLLKQKQTCTKYTYTQSLSHREKAKRKSSSDSNIKSIKRHASMPALSLDLSSLSVREESHHDSEVGDAMQINLNTDNINNNILLHFDIAPRSINSESCYDITPCGAFKQNGFMISSEGLEIERNGNANGGGDSAGRKYAAKAGDFVEVSILGRGSTSVVYKTWDLRHRRFIALKCISSFEHDKRKQIMNELKLLTDHRCPFIVNFHGSYFHCGQIMICLEYCDIGSLQELIEVNGRIPVQIISYILQRIIRAVHYLHAKSIVYRDIKPSNILIHSNGTIKLSDFGIFHQCDAFADIGDQYCTEIIGTMIYMSPQRLRGKQYAYLSDIWSIGMCVAQSVHPAFSLFTDYDESSTLIQKYILQTEQFIFEFFPKHIKMEEVVTDFMMKCLQKNEDDRMSADRLLKHTFVTQADTMKCDDFTTYVKNSSMESLQREKYKNELISMRQSLSHLVSSQKIELDDMQIPLQEIEEILRLTDGEVVITPTEVD